MIAELKKILTMEAEFVAAFPWRRTSTNLISKLFAGCALVLLMTLILLNYSELHAGQNLYYDNKGNLISKEEYEKIVGKAIKN